MQGFTTIGRVMSEKPYQVEQSEGFEPFRVDVDYVYSANLAPIKPLLDRLELTRGRGSNWGIVMRRSKSKLSPHDMRLIVEAMDVSFEQIDNAQ